MAILGITTKTTTKQNFVPSADTTVIDSYKPSSMFHKAGRLFHRPRQSLRHRWKLGCRNLRIAFASI